MKDTIYVFLDITYYLVQGMLLITMLQSAHHRFVFRRQYVSSVILIVQYVATQILLHYSDFVKSILYGKSMIISDSRQSVIPVLINILITYVVSMVLLKEKKLKVFYYVVTFYSITELVKFTFYTIYLRIFSCLLNGNQYLYLEKQMYGIERFYQMISIIDILWNVLFNFTTLMVSYKIIKQIKKYSAMKDAYQKSEWAFLSIPSVIGLLLCIMIRILMFSMDGTNVHMLVDSYPGMDFYIPSITILCIALIILAAKMLRKLLDESNKKIEISVYQNRIKEMEHHIGDIENLYTGIRGMKHDMKNYIANIDALMKQNTDYNTTQTALKQYLNSLQTSVEQLDMKYNTGNPVTDVIIQQYVQLTNKSDIDFQVEFLFPTNMNIDAFDISIIINNALDNALEACKLQENGKKIIELSAYCRENMFFIVIKNSFNGKIIRNKISGGLLTTKSDSQNHGFGIRNIEVCAEKYFGKTEITVRDGYFELAVMLQKRK